ncbi:glucosaminidase domain-containing protein [Marinoscillum sp. MHG1-6]|uniref:glucosaminidase domain-containing protein n=1 Tax=Marinoscillum sp. MHG1-6 TaxID=2959627 RepID=UPI002157D14F|nr:glucosaminidase domain-containing protein [Marinoscillum sp. MHG1-6]
MKRIKTLVIALLGLFLLNCEDREPILKTESLVVKSPDEIIPLDSVHVRPVLYENIPSFAQLTVDESKDKFIAAVLPAILVAQHEMESDRNKINELSNKEQWDDEDSSYYLTQLDRFNANNIEDLQQRMIALPPSLVLAQAAVESGWGSSRFFREGNNLFGIWSYSNNEPRMEAKYDRGERSIYLRTYKNISASITDYFETLGRSRAYSDLRVAASKSSKASDLLPYLKYYSEKREAYVAQLQKIIDQNNLYQYDNRQIDPAYFVSE